MKNKCGFSYAGPMVLGMHDAVVSLIGIIVGLTFADMSRHAIVTTGIIASVAAGLSMTASNYLATKASAQPAALRCGIYTGISYIVTSLLLLVPFMLIINATTALCTSFAIAIFIILLFSFYITGGDGRPFIKRFGEMLLVCASVSAISFLVGSLAK